VSLPQRDLAPTEELPELAVNGWQKRLHLLRGSCSTQVQWKAHPPAHSYVDSHACAGIGPFRGALQSRPEPPRRADNYLNEALPQYEELPKRLLRSAFIGFSASLVCAMPRRCDLQPACCKHLLRSNYN